MKPLFKYWGGKQRIAEWVVDHFPLGYERMIYIEPFCGSAVVLFKKRPSKGEKINDLDKQLLSLFMAVRDRPSKLYNLLANTLYSHNEMRLAEAILGGKVPCKDYTKIAWAKFVDLEMSFLACGMNDSFMTPTNGNHCATFHNKVSWERFDRIHNRLKNVDIFSRPAHEIIAKYDTPNTFFYLDPPYPETDCTGYRDAYTMADFNKLTEQLKGLQGRYLISFEMKPDMECNELDGRHLFRRQIVRNAKVASKTDDLVSRKGEEHFLATECLMSNYKVEKPQQLSLLSLAEAS